MKKVLAILFVVFLCTANAQEPNANQTNRTGEAAGYASRDATFLSLMGWGLVITAGIAVLFALLDNNSTSAHN